MKPSAPSGRLGNASEVLQRYLRAFSDLTSVVVVAPGRVAGAASSAVFAGWHVTDCSAQFVGTARQRTDELVFESSGTTGDPKLVRYRKQVIRDCATAIARMLELEAARDYIALINPRFAYGLSVLHSHHLAGTPVRFAKPPTTLTEWADVRESLRPDSTIYLAPHHSFLLAQDPHWRFNAPIELVFAGGPLRQSMVDALGPCFPNATVTNMYGQAELGPRISIGRSAITAFREGDVGRPLPGVDVRADPQGRISVRSPYRMESYVTAAGEPVPADASADWWPTGDVGRVGADGTVLITGRAASDINFLGGRIGLDHLRQIVRDVDGVLDVRVSAVRHQAFGECPHLRVLIPSMANRDAAERAVRIALSDNIGHAAAAAVVEVLDPASLPESGKL